MGRSGRDGRRAYELLDLDHAPTMCRRAARLPPPRGLSLPRLRGRRRGRDEALDGSGVAAAPRTLCSPRRDKHERIAVRGQDRPVSDKRTGSGDAQKPPRFGWRSVAVFFGLLLLNYVIVSQLSGAGANPRVTIPYQPTFLEQVGDGNVATITAKGATIEGTFENAVRYPDAEATATTDFATEVPEFADGAELDRLLRENGVEVVAKPAMSETPWWLTALMYFGPTLLFFGLWIWFMRRAGAAGGGMLGFGRAKPKQYEPTKERVSFDDVAGIDEAEQELAEVVDFLRDPTKYRSSARASRVACF
jgi:hypothetical protein